MCWLNIMTESLLSIEIEWDPDHLFNELLLEGRPISITIEALLWGVPVPLSPEINYERLLNIEIEWDPDHLFNELLLEDQPIPITTDMVKNAISKMTK